MGELLVSQVLIIIDIQNIYFTEGAYKLYHPEVTAQKASEVLGFFRRTKQPVIHIKHLFNTSGYQEDKAWLNDFYSLVKPVENEAVIEKRFPNSFLETSLQEELEKLGAKDLVIVGMMTHMCVDTTVRMAQNYGYKVTVIDDACTTKSLTYENEAIPADTVHKVFIASLNGKFAQIEKTDSFIQ
jgi:nicotinamidase-related amidase